MAAPAVRSATTLKRKSVLVPSSTSRLDLRRTIVRTCVAFYFFFQRLWRSTHALAVEKNWCNQASGKSCIREIILPCCCFINFFQLLYERQTERRASQAWMTDCQDPICVTFLLHGHWRNDYDIFLPNLSKSISCHLPDLHYFESVNILAHY